MSGLGRPTSLEGHLERALEGRHFGGEKIENQSGRRVDNQYAGQDVRLQTNWLGGANQELNPRVTPVVSAAPSGWQQRSEQGLQRNEHGLKASTT